MYPHSITPRAWLILPGHRDAAARVRVVRYPFWARLWRTAALGAMWGIITLTAFLITVFDPFLSSIPLVLGSASVWRSWRGEFRVQAFEGECPRCAQPVALKHGARIAAMHKLVCYNCHHEPHLALVG